MRESEKQITPSDDDAREAMVRERLGGPADYDESGGTGLGGREADSSLAGGTDRAAVGAAEEDTNADDAATREARGATGRKGAGAEEQQQRRSR